MRLRLKDGRGPGPAWNVDGLLSARGFLLLLALLASCAPLAFFPVEIGRWAAGRLRGGGQPEVLWALAETVHRRRTAVRWALGGLVVVLGGLAAALLALVRERFFSQVPDAGLVLAVLALVGVVAALSQLRASGLGTPGFRAVDDPDLIGRARRAVEGVALAAGIAAPAFLVVAHPRPTAFVMIRRSSPVVVFTSAMVTLAPFEELEAVAAHEVGHIASGGVVESQTVEALLDAVRLLGTACLWPALVLWAQPLAPVLVALTLLPAVVSLRVFAASEQADWARVPARLVDGLLLMVNPPMAAANLLAQTLYFAVGEGEDLLADLRAVEFTRHPEALHAVLRRLRDTGVVGPAMPVGYHFRYFTAEGTLPEGFPSAQAPIAARLALLERLAPPLRAAPAARPRAAACPDCGRPLARHVVASHYGAPIHVDRCAACGGTWFDDLELYLAGARELIEVAARSTGAVPARGSPVFGSVECPRCRVPLRRMPPLGMPADISIWECGVCGGAWVRPTDLARFGAFRTARRGRTTRR
ncbi:MAG: zinc metalloprotease HtpX [Armatimonadota bacterium]|nr:zinc metalloprotease HtpX [Armatimonadota bacterium]